MSAHFVCLLPSAFELKGGMTVGDLLVGVGTLLLASFTYLLATRTSQAVTVSEKGLALSRKSIEALDKPFVIATPNDERQVLGFIEPGSKHPGIRFAHRLWNIGKGPAIVDDLSLVDPSTQHEYLTDVEKIQRAVAIDPAGRDELSPLVNSAPPGVGAHLTLRISYRSASGAKYVTTSKVEVVENLYCICSDFRREES